MWNKLFGSRKKVDPIVRSGLYCTRIQHDTHDINTTVFVCGTGISLGRPDVHEATAYATFQPVQFNDEPLTKRIVSMQLVDSWGYSLIILTT
jgi:hypothetical protein